MIKVTALALFVALCNAEDIESQGASSRRLLQTGPNPYDPYQQQAAYSYGYPPPQLPTMQEYQAQCNPYSTTHNPYQNLHSCYTMSMILLSEFQQRLQAPQPAPAFGANPNPNPPLGAPGVPVEVPVPAPVTPDPAANPGQVAGAPGQVAGGAPGNVPPANNPPATPVYPIHQAPPMPVTPPGHHAVGVNLPGIGVATASMGPLTELTCGPAPPATLCQNRRAGPGGSPLGPLNINGGVSGLANQFKLYCDTPMACSGSEINIDLLPGGFVQQINQLLFAESQSGAQSTINIRNNQGNGNNVELSNVECAAPGSCAGLTLNGWGVALNDMHCPYPSNCAGCKWNNYKTIPDAVCPRPMDPSSIGNPNCILESVPCFGY